MLTLAAGDSIRGVAGAATSVTYTISGLDNAIPKVTQGQVPGSAGTLYTATGTGGHVASIILANTTAGSVTVTLYVNGTAATNQIASIPVPANGEATFTGAGWVVTNAAGAVMLTVPLSGATPTAETVGGAGSAGTVGAASDAGHAHAIAALTDGTHGNLGGGSDHALAIAAGAAGFLAGTDKTKLNNTTGTNSGDQSFTASGDATAPSSASNLALTMATVNSNVGSFGDSSHVAAFTVNAKGLTTAASSVLVTPAAIGAPSGSGTSTGTNTGDQTIAATGDVTAPGSASSLATTLATVNGNVGAFGSATQVATFTVNAKGLTTAASNTAIAIPESAVTNLVTDLAGKVPTTTTLTTTTPITIDGGSSANLSANRTLAIPAATSTVNGYMGFPHIRKLAGFYDAYSDFGYVGDLRGVGDGACDVGVSNVTINSATIAFTASDIGKRITLAGAGASGAMYAGTISARTATAATVSPALSTTVTARALQVGTDNTAATTALHAAVNGTTYPAFKVHFGLSETGAYGFPTALSFNRPVIIEGQGRGFTADQGVADQVGGTRLAWWGLNSGSLFGGFWTFAPNTNNNMKGTGFRDCWLDCGNGTQYGASNSQIGGAALYGVKLATVNGFSYNNFFIRNPAAMGIWCDIDATPTEQESTSRGIMQNICFRLLDSGPSSVTTPFLMTSAVTLSSTPQNLTVAANTLPAAGYFWTMTSIGRPVLVNYTSGGGSTTLVNCTVSAEDSILTPATVANANIVQAVGGNACAAMLSGNTTANTNLSVFSMWQISHGTTWGPAAIECVNADSLLLDQIVINGGEGTNDGAINRIRKPGVRFNGHQTSLSLAARNNAFREGDAGAGGVSNMALLNTGAKMTAPAGPNFWWGYQLGNGAPQPNIEAGGYLEWTANGGLNAGLRNINQANQAYTASTLTQINGSVILLPPQAIQVGTCFRWRFHLHKTATATAAILFNVKVGTAGTTADANVQAFSVTPTAADDQGMLELTYNLTAKGASATGVGTLHVNNVLTSVTGLINAANPIIGTPTAFSSSQSGFYYISLAITTGATEVVNSGYCTAEVIRIGSQGA